MEQLLAFRIAYNDNFCDPESLRAYLDLLKNDQVHKIFRDIFPFRKLDTELDFLINQAKFSFTVELDQ